ncbi:MAG TPA: sigma-70 family RNA polymerase sigma factor [Chitinophagaceae bacterium]|nr:sigma-70 family RNA polymerase sigma factor [Chitinophagaceae bacterium]
MAKEKEHIKTDEELLALFYADKNNYWLGILLERYTLLMLGVCLKYLKNVEDAKDAVQQVCTQIIADLKRHEVQHFKAWLLVVTRNHCLMQYRKKDTKNNLEFTDNLIVEDAQINKEERWLKEVTLDTIKESMNVLIDAQRICIDLFYLQEKSYKEIMASTGFDFKQVKTHIQNGKRNLKLIVLQQLINQKNSIQ